MTTSATARVLVCGGRDYANRDRVFDTLDRINTTVGIECIIHGGARGADTLAGEWATVRGVTVYRFPAQWETHGKAAGPLRNARMLREGKPNMCIAFPGGRGTADMVRRAKAAKVYVLEGLW